MIRPKFELFAFPFGFAKCGVLLRLNDSARNCRLTRLGELEGAEQAQVHVHHTGTAHRVPAHSAKPDSRGPRKCAGIEPGAVVAGQADLLTAA